MRTQSHLVRTFFVALVALVLAVRGFVPAGWMPSGEKAFAISVCTGVEMQKVWMTKDGTIHKSDPSKKQHKEDDGSKACPFAIASLSILPALTDDSAIVAQSIGQSFVPTGDTVAIGRGLAAPPPPSTGPPILS